MREPRRVHRPLPTKRYTQILLFQFDYTRLSTTPKGDDVHLDKGVVWREDLTSLQTPHTHTTPTVDTPKRNLTHPHLESPSDQLGKGCGCTHPDRTSLFCRVMLGTQRETFYPVTEVICRKIKVTSPFTAVVGDSVSTLGPPGGVRQIKNAVVSRVQIPKVP